MPTLKDINNHVVPQWSPNWRMKLGVDHQLMSIIDHGHPNDCIRLVVARYLLNGLLIILLLPGKM